MTSLRHFAFAAASGLLLAACTPTPEDTLPATPGETETPAEPAAEETETLTPEAAPVEEACAVLDSRDWEAWVNRMPGPDASPAIHVIGKVDVNTGGYTFNWEVGPMDRSMTPALRLKLIPVAPTDAALMAISTEEVQYTGPLAGSAYSSVTVTCGGQTLAEITEIPDVH